MKFHDVIFALLEAVVWYVFIAYFIFSIKAPVNVFQSAFVLLFLAGTAGWLCPLLRKTCAWRRLWGEEE